MKSGGKPDFNFETRGSGETRDSFDPVGTALSLLIAPELERATGFETERSDVLDVKSG